MDDGSVSLHFGEAATRTKSAAATTKFRWQPTIEFVLAIALIGDAVMIFAALSFGFWLRFGSALIPLYADTKSIPTFQDYFRLLSVGTLFLLGTLGYLGMYSQHSFLSYLRTAKVVVQGTTFWLFAYLSSSLILKFDPPISRLFMLASFVSALLAILLWRNLYFRLMHWKAFALNFRQRVLFIGWGKDADRLEKEIKNDPRHPFDIIGCLSSPQGLLRRTLPPLIPYLGNHERLGHLLAERQADIVILADPYIRMNDVIAMANQCEMEFVHFKVIPSYFRTLASGLRLEMISGVPVLGVSDLPLNRLASRLIKRTVDIIGATFGLLISIPLMVVFGSLVYRESPGPIIYSQTRMGKNGRRFKIFKIRSMRMDSEANGAQWAKENDPRRLRIGALIRKWNIDEIPQFLNVLIGDMSLVGPRPERPELISKFKHEIPHYHARHTCLPGMTGWAQIHGWRGNTSLDERIRCDIWYVENWSIGLDIRIMALTFLRRKNAY